MPKTPHHCARIVKTSKRRKNIANKMDSIHLPGEPTCDEISEIRAMRNPCDEISEIRAMRFPDSWLNARRATLRPTTRGVTKKKKMQKNKTKYGVCDKCRAQRKGYSHCLVHCLVNLNGLTDEQVKNRVYKNVRECDDRETLQNILRKSEMVPEDMIATRVDDETVENYVDVDVARADTEDKLATQKAHYEHVLKSERERWFAKPEALREMSRVDLKRLVDELLGAVSRANAAKDERDITCKLLSPEEVSERVAEGFTDEIRTCCENAKAFEKAMMDKMSKEASKCVACRTKSPSTVFDSCGHKCMCAECAENVDACPLCRKAIGKRILVHE